MADLEYVITVVSSVGFPIVVAGYLLVFQERLLRRLVQAIETLQAQIQKNQQDLINMILTHTYGQVSKK